MAVPTYRVENFPYGIVDSLEPKSIPPGSASRSLNWLSLGDKIELRGGQDLIGTGLSGAGKILGLHTGLTFADAEVPLKAANNKKVYYYDVTTEDWVEIGSTILSTAEDVSFANFKPLAGAQAWLNSPNNSIIKIMMNSGKSGTGFVAPAHKDQYLAANNYKGFIKIVLNRMLLWGRVADKSGLYGSKIDERAYTTVTAEAYGTGDGTTKTFAATLAAVTGRRTCFALSITDGTETFTDNNDGTLTGGAGGTGTINYSTGAASVTFAVAPTNLQAITASYQWEDSAAEGIADFRYTSPTRVAGEGFYFAQGEGGELLFVGSFNNKEFCLHLKKAWSVELTNDDTGANNFIFRDGVGVPGIRGAVATGDGIYYIDDRDQKDIRVRLVKIDRISQKEVPVPVSNNIKLTDYRFDQAAGFEWGDYILFACRTIDSVDSSDVGVNNRVLLYNRRLKARPWDVVDYYARAFLTYNGALWGGHSLNNNVYELFSGYDDNGSVIDNYWESNLDEMQIRELKKSRKLIVEGEIQPDQDIDVYLETDNGGYVLIGTIAGDGAYVDAGAPIAVGQIVAGQKVVGGSSGSNTTYAYHYFREFSMRRLVGRFQKAKIKFVATAIGYASVSSYEFSDITRHGSRMPSNYRDQ